MMKQITSKILILLTIIVMSVITLFRVINNDDMLKFGDVK